MLEILLNLHFPRLFYEINHKQRKSLIIYQYLVHDFCTLKISYQFQKCHELLLDKIISIMSDSNIKSAREQHCGLPEIWQA